jgi:hypothetical protein
VVGKQLDIIISAIKVSKVLCVQPEHHKLDATILHAEIHQLQNDDTV